MPGTRAFNFTTGSTYLPDVGQLSYNGCTFSPLFETKISGKVVRDAANRTTKYMEYTLVADGYVTIGEFLANDINPAMTTLRNLLTAQGGALVYKGRGFDLVINANTLISGAPPRPGSANPLGNIMSTRDVAWGPVPELIEFQPLGAGQSAKVQWRVVVRIPQIAMKGKGLLQLNYETSVVYGEDGFSTLSMRGTLEIPITRNPLQSTRTVNYTVDDYRKLLEDKILAGIDLSRFRITRREFPVSRDKRTMEWAVEAEEKPYMDLPMDCTVARGSFSVRPSKIGAGLATWLCTLRATYTVANPSPERSEVFGRRRNAWLLFLALLRLRMLQSEDSRIPKQSIDKPQEGGKPGFFRRIFEFIGSAKPAEAPKEEVTPKSSRRAFLLDFSFDEGLYLDSKNITFSATWRLVVPFRYILIASGAWRKVAETDNVGDNLWAASMKGIVGSQSWLVNRLDPAADVIVDFGGP